MTTPSVLRPRPCPRCGAAVSAFRLPASWRQALVGGWTCPGCGVQLDRVGHPLDEYPEPGPYRYWTRTRRGAVLMLLGGMGELLVAALLVVLAVAFPETSAWWRWLGVVVLVLLAVPSIVLGALSVGAHRRRPWPHPTIG